MQVYLNFTFQGLLDVQFISTDLFKAFRYKPRGVLKALALPLTTDPDDTATVRSIFISKIRPTNDNCALGFAAHSPLSS